MTQPLQLISSGLFSAAIFFLVAAGLQLIVGGLALGVFGPLFERFLSQIYERDEAFQLLLTFALLLMLEDAMRFIWGGAAQSTGTFYLVYGQAEILGATVPVYNLVVIAASVLVAAGLAFMLARTSFGRILRATADNREMAEALGANMR